MSIPIPLSENTSNTHQASGPYQHFLCVYLQHSRVLSNAEIFTALPTLTFFIELVAFVPMFLSEDLCSLVLFYLTF